MSILAIDASTKSTGYAIFNDSKELIDYNCITASSTDLIKRIYKMGSELKEVILKYQPETIILEEVYPESGGHMQNIKTHKALMFLQAHLNFLVHDSYPTAKIEYIYPSQWRSKCGIKTGQGVKRTSLKEEDIAFVKTQYNIVVNDDIADAICIGHSYFVEEKPSSAFWGK